MSCQKLWSVCDLYHLDCQPIRYFPTLGIFCITTDTAAVMMNAAIPEANISTGVVQKPSRPSSPLPSMLRMAPEIGTSMRRWLR